MQALHILGIIAHSADWFTAPGRLQVVIAGIESCLDSAVALAGLKLLRSHMLRFPGEISREGGPALVRLLLHVMRCEGFYASIVLVESCRVLEQLMLDPQSHPAVVAMQVYYSIPVMMQLFEY